MGPRSIVGLGLAVLLGSFAFAAAPAAAETRIAITPAILRLDGVPGGTGEVAIIVTNRGDTTFMLAVATVTLSGISMDRSAFEWLSVRPDGLRVEPGASNDVTVVITIPDDIPSGGYYAAVTFTTGAPEASGNVTTTMGRIVVPIWIAVQGGEALTRVPVIDRFAAVLEADGRVGFQTIVRNDGNVHAMVGGAIDVRGEAEGLDAALEIKGRGVLPGSAVLFSALGTLPLPADDRYEATMTLASPRDSGPGTYAPVTATMAFEPTPSLAVAAPVACENLDRGPTLSADLRNDGSVGAIIVGTFEVIDSAGGIIGVAAPVDQPISWPNEVAALSAELPERLVSGEYTLVVRAAYGFDSVIEKSAPFRIGGDPVGAIPLCAAPTAVAP